jgi:hypothetical protein
MDSTNFMSSFGFGIWGVGLVFFVLIVAGMWAVFAKAGHPGWAAIIPIYNVYVLIKVAGRPGWWLILFFIPFVNFIIALVIYWDVAKAFGHGFLMWLGLVFFPYIFFLVLGFGGSQYQLARN